MNDTAVLEAIDRMLATVRTAEKGVATVATQQAGVATENLNDFNGDGHTGHTGHKKQDSYIHRHGSEDVHTSSPRDCDYASRSNIDIKKDVATVATVAIALEYVEKNSGHANSHCGHCGPSSENTLLARECRWHLAHGERVDRAFCAGCRRPIGADEVALDLADGNRVHLAAGYDCLIRHGARWRAAAHAALIAHPVLSTSSKPPENHRGGDA